MIIRPKEAAANAPLMPPRGIEAGRPTIHKAVARLAVESKVENISQPAALQLTAFLARLYFLRQTDNERLLRREKLKLHLLFAF